MNIYYILIITSIALCIAGLAGIIVGCSLLKKDYFGDNAVFNCFVVLFGIGLLFSGMVLFNQNNINHKRAELEAKLNDQNITLYIDGQMVPKDYKRNYFSINGYNIKIDGNKVYLTKK